MDPHHDHAKRHVAVLRAKIADAAAQKASADASLAEMRRAAGAAVADFFRAPGAACRLSRRIGGRDDLTAAARRMACLWRFGPEDRPALIGFSGRLTVAAADIAIARALSREESAAPTAIDRAVAAALARRLIAAVTPDIPGTEDRANAPAHAANLDELLARNKLSAWRIDSFEIDPGGGEAFPAFAATAQEAAVPATPGVDSQAPQQALLRRFGSLRTAAICVAGGFEAPLARVLKFAPGDVVAINWIGAGAAPLMLGKQEFAKGSLGEQDGKRAIKLGAD